MLTKIDQVPGNTDLVKILTETSQSLKKYDFFVKPEIHMVCPKENFGIEELRSRIAIGFELNNYINH